MASEQLIIKDRMDVKFALIRKYGTLTRAAHALGVNYFSLSHTLNGRLRSPKVVEIVSSDLGISTGIFER